jgi:plasmid stabilization system protein ParE
VERTLKELARMPGAGSPKDFAHPVLGDVRTWRVKGFPNHLIYYMPLADGIDVLALMHGAQEPQRKLRQRIHRRRR